MIRASVLKIALLCSTAVMLLNCNDVDAAIDCGSICDRYKDCFNEDYDVEACTDRCKDSADKDRNYRDDADACHDCIDDRSCGGGAFSCAIECAGVVP
jgi:hypothetical protein